MPECMQEERMAINYSEKSKKFHIFNDKISYIIQILDDNCLGNLYFGKHIHDKEDFSHLLQGGLRSLAVFHKENYYFMSPQYTKMEYPTYGTGDYRHPAVEIKQENGSRVVFFEYESYKIFKGKKKLMGLPATYVESEQEAETLEITLIDKLLEVHCILSYTIYKEYPVITRNARFINNGSENVILERALSASVDLPDADFELLTLSGAWSRERHVKTSKLQQGIQGVYSKCGVSSAEHNPCVILKRPNTDESIGEAYGFSLVYSGNHMEQIEVDTNDLTRVLIGIHPDTFEWPLNNGEEFQTPEAVMVYSDEGLNKMSQTFHKLYRTRLVRGIWRDKARPILINNWEATETNFTEEQILEIARTGKALGMELFVLDDGWFGKREDDKTSLGDWYVTNFKKLPDGINGLSQKIEALGMKFGLWFEPEMVNKDSDLYRAHPDWILQAPGRSLSLSRNQYVLDFSRPEVVDHIYNMMERILDTAHISYVKWDMNRYISECYSNHKPASRQGMVFHEYILGVYSLYERLIEKFPDILFESCSSGGARFDPGMLYYAPQAWTSDDTDAVERLKIQYGTSYVYPLSSMGAHVSKVPNLQVGRTTPIETRGNVAQFGVFGYELNLNLLSEEEKTIVGKQVAFAKEHRELLHQGLFYRINSPFEEVGSWMVVSEDREKAIAAYYKLLSIPNEPWRRLYLKGLDKDKKYVINNDNSRVYYGDELMNAGMVIHKEDLCAGGGDFTSAVYFIKAVEKSFC